MNPSIAGCWARAPRATTLPAIPAIPVMKSRRRIAFPRLRTRWIWLAIQQDQIMKSKRAKWGSAVSFALQKFPAVHVTDDAYPGPNNQLDSRRVCAALMTSVDSTVRRPLGRQHAAGNPDN